jgi:hypothetical protein
VKKQSCFREKFPPHPDRRNDVLGVTAATDFHCDGRLRILAAADLGG